MVNLRHAAGDLVTVAGDFSGAVNIAVISGFVRVHVHRAVVIKHYTGAGLVIDSRSAGRQACDAVAAVFSGDNYAVGGLTPQWQNHHVISPAKASRLDNCVGVVLLLPVSTARKAWRTAPVVLPSCFLN